MKKLIFILFIFFLSSCEGDIVFYEYNGVAVTRVDRGNKLYFYYGKKGTPSFDKKTYFRLTYKGLNGAAGAGLKFIGNGMIQIDRMYGYFTIRGDTSKMCVPPPRNLLHPDWRDSTFENSFVYNNIVIVFNNLEAERDVNKIHHSKVNVTYTKERSIWNIFY